MDLGLAGKRAVVTGGTRGIGRAIAEHLAAEGCAVARQPKNSAEADQGNNKSHQKCSFIGFLKGDTNLTKERSFPATLCSNCKHS